MSRLEGRMTREEMMEEVDGYEPHWNEIDATVGVEDPCEKCHSKFVSYQGFKLGTSYRAFVVCSRCGHCQEF